MRLLEKKIKETSLKGMKMKNIDKSYFESMNVLIKKFDNFKITLTKINF